MPHALIAGCGYLGEALAGSLIGQDWDVECWTRSAESAQKVTCRQCALHAVDISNPDQVRGRDGNFDVVVHSASTRGGGADAYRRVYLNGVRNLLERFGNSKILFTSSTSVYAQTSGEHVTEKSPAAPKTETGTILREAENLVLARNGIVVRIGGIYGPGRSALLRKFLRGDAILDPEKDRFVNAIHRDDAAAALGLLAQQTGNAGEIFNVVDDEPVLQSDCYRWLATRLNRPLPPVGRSTSARKRGESNKRVSNAKLRSLSWAPIYPSFAVGMEKSVLPALDRLGA